MGPDELANGLAELSVQHRRRKRMVMQVAQGALAECEGQPCLNFAANDYLGLAGHPVLVDACIAGARRWGVGSGASALVSGYYDAHCQAERELAAFVGRDAALLFTSGYAANQSVLGSLLGRGDAVFGDRLNHASLNDGCLLSRATFRRFRHNDLDHLASLLEATPARTRLIAVDAVYSMDGDEAPLADLLGLARRYDAWLYVDDAHGFGLLGEGHGSACASGLADDRLIYMATLGKAAGVSGAFVAGGGELIEWLVNTARDYIYTTAAPPMLAEAVRASLRLIAGESWRRDRVFAHVRRLGAALAVGEFEHPPSRMPIQPLIIGNSEQTSSLSERLRAQGIWVPAIRPPTVAEGRARLRISLSAAHDDDMVSRLIAALGDGGHGTAGDRDDVGPGSG
ncbi:8-amino-7-oxononanoate synthase [Paludibacterium yongneupense]|uniref:8-amino-7-oxononanoate synthase n=1 Tax=Paludibacterium yongneupense TaxID=400061 RepID=UPI0003F670DF|nr:8-amino-7-oxononanoate synthase [Paludibacterium yongneupense]